MVCPMEDARARITSLYAGSQLHRAGTACRQVALPGVSVVAHRQKVGNTVRLCPLDSTNTGKFLMITAPELSSKRHQVGGFGLLAGVALLLTACASAPLPPTVALDAAQSAIGNAEVANAGRFASAELAEAREKLSRANTAASNSQMIAAERLAEESKLAAELALARTETAKAVAINSELSKGVDALSEEMQRAGDQR